MLVTRAAEDTAQLAHSLEAAGFEPVRVPLIQRIWKLPSVVQAAASHPDVDWIVVTSAVTAEILGAACPLAWPNARIAAVGPATARRLAATGRIPDLVATRHTGTALAAEMPDLSESTVLYPRADLTPPATADALRARGALVVEVIAYQNIAPEGHKQALLNALPVDATTLLSGSAAQRLAAVLQPEDHPELGVVVAIGPTTAAVAEQCGLPVHEVADPYTLNGLFATLDKLRRDGAADQR